MSTITICRICLAENVRMHVVQDTNLLAVYEKLCNNSSQTKYAVLVACYICYRQLTKCLHFMLKVQQADTLLAQVLKEDGQTQLSHIDRRAHSLTADLSMSPVEFIVIVETTLNDIIVKSEVSLDVVKNGVKLKEECDAFKIDARRIQLTQEQQMQELLQRAQSINYLNSPYKCELCFKGFVDTRAYDNHKEKHDELTINRDNNQLSSNLHTKHYTPDHCDLYIENNDEIQYKAEEPSEINVDVEIKHETASSDMEYLNENDELEKENDIDIVEDDFIASDKDYSTDDSLPLEKHRQKEEKVKKKVEKVKKVRKIKDVREPKIDRRREPFLNDELNETLFTIADLSIDEQIAEINKRQDSANYKNSVFKCTECFKGFLDEDAYNSHMIRHTDMPPKRDFPSFVPRAALTIPNVFLHIAPSVIPGTPAPKKQKIESKNEQPKIFATKTPNLSLKTNKKHPKKKYVKNKPTVLNTSTVSEQDVKGNVEIPTNNRKKSTETEELIINNVYIECNECGEKFKSKNALRQHIGIHTVNAYFKCTECKYQNVTKDALERHMRFHDKKRLFECNYCSYRFKTASNLNTHKLSHIDKCKKKETIHNCDICEFKSPSVNIMESHLLEHAGLNKSQPSLEDYRKEPDQSIDSNGIDVELKSLIRKTYACNTCQFKSTDSGNLKSHMRIHTGEKPYACNICQYKFTQSGHLKSHMRIHTGEKPYACTICQFKCTRSGDLKSHVRIHTGEKPYACTICQFKCIQSGDLKTHMRIHTGEKPYACSICQYKSTVSTQLKLHMRIHTGQKPYACNICQYKFTKSGHLKSHMRIHTGEKPYACTICQFKCIQSGDLKTHMRIHTGEKPYACSICQYKSTVSTQLKLHMRIHTGQKPYACNICQYKFTKSGHLKSHMRIHTGEKPYACTICQFKCIQSGDLKTHMRIHTGEKPYACSICQYKSTVSTQLKLHMRIHTGEKPYACNICQYTCTQRSSLKMHMRRHTGEKPYACNICQYKCIHSSSLKRHMRIHTGE